MKSLVLTFTVLLSFTGFVYSQKYMTRTGRVHFNAIVPGTPEVEAVNNEVATILDSKSGEMIFQVLIKSFKFQRELMQEHFNENYLESDKYPKSEFKGMITNISDINFSKDGAYNATVTGKLTIHNVTRDVTVPGTITVKGNTIDLKARFSVTIKDYDIKIPEIVANKVAKVASIDVESNLTQK